jgi:hypothetical protein
MSSAKKPQFEETTIDQLIPDSANLNKGTERGNYMIERSIRELGWGRPIVVDKNNHIIGGNHAAEVAGQLGFEKVKIIETSGDEIVVHRRMDLDLSTDDPKARLLSIADNRSSQVSLNWDASGLAEIAASTPDLGWFFQKNELDLLQGLVEPPTESTALPTNPEMATSPAWAKGSDDEDYGDEDNDDELVAENAGLERMLNAGAEEEEEEDEPEVLAGRPVPLPIVLLPSEMRQWRKAKEQLGYSRDKAAFLAMVQQYLEQIEPATESEIN